MRPLVIYHSPCPDGFTAAWALTATTASGTDHGYDFHPGVHGQPPPDVGGRDVIILDFSYKRPVIEKIASEAASLLVLDHHASAQADLDFLPLPALDGRLIGGYNAEEMRKIGPCAIFDMTRSGAGLAWDFFNYKLPRPKLVDMVEDRDLWRNEIEGSADVQSVVLSYEYGFENWDVLAERIESETDAVISEGVAIRRKLMKDVHEMVSSSVRRARIAGFDVPVINVPYTYGSEAANIMCRGEPFAAYYYDKPAHREWGLRSSDGGEDVSKIAVSLGGGGHPRASGFRTGLDYLGDP